VPALALLLPRIARLDVELQIAEDRTFNPIVLRREIQRVAEDYDYDWKGQLENLEDISPGSSDNTNGSRDKRFRGSDSDHTATAGSSNMSQTEVGKTGEVVSLSDGPTSGQDESTIDVDATINEAVELEEQTRLEQKRRRRGKGSKGELPKAEEQKD
jgi:hypothetical protein